jgi:hypothetical protein
LPFVTATGWAPIPSPPSCPSVTATRPVPHPRAPDRRSSVTANVASVPSTPARRLVSTAVGATRLRHKLRSPPCFYEASWDLSLDPRPTITPDPKDRPGCPPAAGLYTGDTRHGNHHASTGPRWFAVTQIPLPMRERSPHTKPHRYDPGSQLDLAAGWRDARTESDTWLFSGLWDSLCNGKIAEGRANSRAGTRGTSRASV